MKNLPFNLFFLAIFSFCFAFFFDFVPLIYISFALFFLALFLDKDDKNKPGGVGV